MRKTGRTKALLAMFLAAASLQAGTAFGAQAATGSQLQAGTWVKEDAGWKYRKPSGEMATGWVHTASGWYYLQPETGIMATGMLRINDRTYYFNQTPDAVEGKMVTGWYQDAAGKWYFFSTTADSTEGAAVTGWQWVDGRSYYFEPAAGENTGKMFANGVTPDGYKVNADGQWVDENGNIQVVPGKGFSSNPGKDTNSKTTVRGGGGGGSSHSSSGSTDNGNNNANNGNTNNGNTNNGNTNNGNTNNGNTNDSNSSNDNTNNGNNSNNGNNQPDQNKAVFVKQYQTKLTELNSLGWWITVAFEDGYNAGNTKVYADGVDVTAALSNVTDDGSICKLAVTKAPAVLTVSSNDDGAQVQTVSLDDTAADGIIYTGDSYLPEKIMTHGPVSIWDYYLTNYADDGSVRYSPSKTTFALGEKPVAHPAYSPDAELGEDGKATVTIMFNYNTDDEKEWFDGINRLQLVEYNENKNTINSDLVFDRAKDVAHGSGRVGELTIKSGQGNFTNNGRYYVRVESKAGTSALVPIHVVNAQAPVLKLQETAQSGVNLHFQVENMVYGIETPISRVVLEGPTETVELNEIDDWFLFSQDLFVLYNDNVDHLKYKGNYKLTVYADGFKATSVRFKVTNGENVPSKDEMGISQYSFDGVSTASTGSGGGSSSGESSSGSSAISANLVFDTDLLVNAELLEEAGRSTAESEAVVDWWYNIIKDAVFDRAEGKYYDWTDYVSSVENKKYEDDQILSFEDYKRIGVTWSNSPATAKEVLEDGLLGEIQNNGDFARPAAGAFTVEQNKEGENVVLKHENAQYLAAIKNVVINDSWTGLAKDKYTVDVEKGTLTLDQSLFTPGEEYKIAVEADGYQMNAFKITYDQLLEEGLTLTVKYPDGKNEYASDKRTFGKIQGYYADAEVDVTGSEGGFLKYLTSVVLDEDDTLYTKGYEGSDAAYYEISADKKSLTIGNIKPGTHTLTLRAKGYVDALTAQIVVAEGVDEPEVTFVPVVKSLEYKEAGFFMSPANYYITFENDTDTDAKKVLADYLDAVKSVTVGDVTYTKALLGLGYNNNEFAASVVDSGYGSINDCLRMTVDTGFTGDTVEIVVEAEGYDTITLTAVKNGNGRYVLKDGSEIVPPAEDKDAPKLTGQLNIQRGNEWTLKGNAEYLKAITSVKYGEEELDTTVNDTEITIDTSELPVGTHKLTIEADGYKSQVIEVIIESDGNAGEDEGVEGLTFEKAHVKYWFDDYDTYRLTFTDEKINDVSRDLYLKAIDYIEVGDVKYSYGTPDISKNSNKFKQGGTNTETGEQEYIDFTTDIADFGTDGTPVKVTIYSTAKADYDPYVFYLKAGKLVAAPGEDNSGDNGNDESDKDITFEEVSVDSFLAKYEAYRLLLKVDTINDISRDTYLGAIDYIMVGQHQYESCSYGSISDQQFKVGTTPESDGMGKGKDYIDFAKDGFDAYETGDLIKVTIYSKKSEYGSYVFYVRDGELVDPTEAEEELLDEQEMKEEAQEEVTVPETKDETVVPEVPAEEEPADKDAEEVPAEDEVTEPSEEDKEDTAEEPAEDKPEEDASEDKDSEDKDTEETPAEEDKEDASEDNNSEDSNEDVSEDNAADDVAEDTEATETEGEI